MPVFYITVAMSKWLTVTSGGQIIQTVRGTQAIQSSHTGVTSRSSVLREEEKVRVQMTPESGESYNISLGSSGLSARSERVSNES